MLHFGRCSIKFAGSAPCQKKAVKTNKVKSANDDPQKVAEEICNCVNNFFSQYHPSIKKMVEDMVEFGQEKAMENFQNTLLNLQGKEQEKAILDAQNFSKDVEEGKMDNCIKAFEARTASMNETQKAQVMKELESSPACKMVDDLMKLGQK
ncbi:MAG: hypothetical protein OHK0045_11540 [Raineya sp.]